MQVTETSNEGLKREYTVVIPKEDIDGRMTERLTEVGTTVNVPGFRPGKVPLAILKKRFGDAVRGEILERTIQESIQQAIEEKELRPAMEPKIDLVTFEDGADLEYKLTVEVIPDIEPIDFGTIELERLVADVPDADVQTSMERLADQQKSYAVAEGRAAEDGDQLLMNFVGRIDGEAFDGGAADGMELVLGSGQFIPGFEDQLIGAKAGEKKTVKVDFPADYGAETLAGKAAEFEVDVTEVRSSAKVEIDDEFAKSMGAEDLAALQSMVRDQIGSEYTQISRGRLKRELLDKLSDQADFDVPPGMLEDEFQSIWKQLEEAKEKGSAGRGRQGQVRRGAGGTLSRDRGPAHSSGAAVVRNRPGEQPDRQPGRPEPGDGRTGPAFPGAGSAGHAVLPGKPAGDAGTAGADLRREDHRLHSRTGQR